MVEYTNKFMSLMTLTISVGIISYPFTLQASETPSNNIQDIFVKAESTTDKLQAIGSWRKILKQIESNALDTNPAITSKILKQNIVNDYVLLFNEKHDINTLFEARKEIRSWKSNKQQSWAYIFILNNLSNIDKINTTSKLHEFIVTLIDDIEINALNTKDTIEKSRIFYSLAIIITKTNKNNSIFNDDTLSLVHSFISHIIEPKNRVHAIKSYAKTGVSRPNIIPSEYASLYRIMAQEKIDKLSLVALHKKAYEQDKFNLSLTALLAIEDKKYRPNKLNGFFKQLFDNGEFSRARRVAISIYNPPKAANVWSRLGGHYLEHGYIKQSKEAYDKAYSYAARIKKTESRNKAIKVINERKEKAKKKSNTKQINPTKDDKKKSDTALKFIKDYDIINAVKITKTISDPIFRVKLFRKIAEKQALQNDQYGIINNNDSNQNFYTRTNTSKKNPTQKIINAYEASIAKETSKDPNGLIVKQGLTSELGERIYKDDLPQRLKYDGDHIKSIVPFASGAEIERSYYENNIFNSKFYGVNGNASFVETQKITTPEIIVIENGVIDLGGLYDELQNQGLKNHMVKDGSTYILRRPLVISNNATLIITGDDVSALKLSTQYGAYIINVGKLFISDTKIIGWDEDKNQPKWTKYKDKRKFRPYITAWSRSHTYIGNSEIIALGYGNGKSYGISLSSGPNKWAKLGNLGNTNRPTGIIVDNSINNTLYGFYSYEADDVTLSGNEYIDNVVYGIDPHDRSRRLAIGYNTAYGTHKKHGIIISREVNDSLIMGNVTFENKGTGIMLDRDSNQTLVYANTSFHNNQEGMTIFESDCAIIAANKLFENNGSGLRIRNSYNIGIFYNNLLRNRSGLSAYTAKLKSDLVHAHRDFNLDPYDTLTSISAVGNIIESNNTGIFTDKIDALFLKKNQFISQSPKIFRGSWWKDNPGILFRFDIETNGVSLNSSCPNLDEILKAQSCKFRKNKTLFADGQDNLINRIKLSACAKGVVKQSPHKTNGAH